ncbi:MAG: hypothetical protein ISN28_14935 [Ectothiorhodospiraceae bacterium AqS1]|nr:hypothetical protein [Ectothiorhodospiraceae bacterium AqS1]
MSRILRVIALIASMTLLASCTDDPEREAVSAKTPQGLPFHFMPIDSCRSTSRGIDKITIMSAWPMHWAYRANNNPAVPYVAADSILSGGTEELEAQEVLEFFNDRDSRGRLYIRADHVIGKLTFPREDLEGVVSMTSELLSKPQFDPAWVERIKKGLSANQTQSQAKIAYRMHAVARLAVLGDGPPR